MSDKQPSFLGRLIKGVFSLACLIAIVLMFMYSERIARYPWSWSGDDWKGFGNYAMMKGEEVKTGTLDLVETIKDTKFGQKLDALAAKYFDKKTDEAVASETPDTPEPSEAAPEYSEGEKLWLEGYELRREGNRAEGDAQSELYGQAVDVWKKAVPVLQTEIETAREAGDENRAAQLEELLTSLNQHLHSIFKDSSM